MGLLDKLKETLKNKKQQPSLKRLVRKQTGAASSRIFISDRHIDLCTDEEIRAFLEKDNTDRKKYIPELFDCEQFSFLLFCNAKEYFAKKGKNCAFGIIWTSNHALCLFVNQEMEIKYIEPQSDQIVSVHSKARLVIL